MIDITMKKLFFDMDGVLVDFQSGIDKLSEEAKREYEGRPASSRSWIPCQAPSRLRTR